MELTHPFNADTVNSCEKNTEKHWDRFLFRKNNTIASCHISDAKAV